MDRVTVIPNFAAARDLNDLKRMLTQHWSEMANLVNNSFTLYVQDTQPTIPNNTTSLWQDTSETPNEYYLVSSFGGTHRLLHPKELAALHFQKARAYRNAAMNVSGDTKIALDTDAYDPTSITDLTNGRIKPTLAGYYYVTGQVSIDLPTTKNAQIMLKRQTTIMCYGNLLVNATAGNIAVQLVVSDIFYMDGANDYVELWANASASSAINNNGTTDNYLALVGPF